MGDYNKMKISEMREVARSRGLRGWTALRKNDLRDFLVNSDVESSSSSVRIRELEKRIKELEDNEIQNLPPPLEPTPYQPPTPTPKSRTKTIASKKSWRDWLLSYVPEPIKSGVSRMKRQIFNLYNSEPAGFKIKLSDSAFNNFIEKYIIEGAAGVDATSFLEMVKRLVVEKLQGKGNIKFRIVLVCIMEKLNPSEKKTSGEGGTF